MGMDGPRPLRPPSIHVGHMSSERPGHGNRGTEPSNPSGTGTACIPRLIASLLRIQEPLGQAHACVFFKSILITVTCIKPAPHYAVLATVRSIGRNSKAFRPQTATLDISSCSVHVSKALCSLFRRAGWPTSPANDMNDNRSLPLARL